MEKGTIILNNIIKNLKAKNWTLSIAESATGGLISSTIVSLESGVSSIYKGCIVCYSEESKMRLLGVKQNTINKYGTISKYAAVEMAIGAKRVFNSDVSIAITGNIGPKSSEGKAVGLIYFVIAINDYFYEYEMTIPDLGRSKNRIIAAQEVLKQLDNCLQRIISREEM